MENQLPNSNGAAIPEVSSSAAGSTVCAFCHEPETHTLGDCPSSLSRDDAIAALLAARKSVRELVAAFYRYEMDVAGEADAPPAHRDMMRRAEAILSNTKLSDSGA